MSSIEKIIRRNNRCQGKGDLISSESYFRLLNDFKEYDERRKKVIEELQAEIRSLTQENRILKISNPNKAAEIKIRDLEGRVKAGQNRVKEWQRRYMEQKKTIEKLVMENNRLRKHITWSDSECDMVSRLDIIRNQQQKKIIALEEEVEKLKQNGFKTLLTD